MDERTPVGALARTTGLQKTTEQKQKNKHVIATEVTEYDKITGKPTLKTKQTITDVQETIRKEQLVAWNTEKHQREKSLQALSQLPLDMIKNKSQMFQQYISELEEAIQWFQKVRNKEPNNMRLFCKLMLEENVPESCLLLSCLWSWDTILGYGLDSSFKRAFYQRLKDNNPNQQNQEQINQQDVFFIFPKLISYHTIGSLLYEHFHLRERIPNWQHVSKEERLQYISFHSLVLPEDEEVHPCVLFHYEFPVFSDLFINENCAKEGVVPVFIDGLLSRLFPTFVADKIAFQFKTLALTGPTNEK
jgi:hypothetical protein